MIRTILAVVALSAMLVGHANAWNDILNSVWGSKGNDTGGIIPWSLENEKNSFEIASAQCARWNKFPVATSIHRMPGDYISYKCVWDPPVVAARHTRHYRRVDVTIDK
jgi:hypothetical protein